MGLTIHYDLGCPGRLSFREAVVKVEALHAIAAALGFSELSKVCTLREQDCLPERYRVGEGDWAYIASQSYVLLDDNDTYSVVRPLRAVGFIAVPGEDCEAMLIGLARYPRFVDVNGIQRDTQRVGWSWTRYCKTQYASRHGIEHFLRCHLKVIALLDAAQEAGFRVSVDDDSNFWQTRDIAALAKTVGEWNEATAALVGKLKDSFSGRLVSPITTFSDFEHLEARGRSHE
jgi:hypothetical protein